MVAPACTTYFSSSSSLRMNWTFVSFTWWRGCTKYFVTSSSLQPHTRLRPSRSRAGSRRAARMSAMSPIGGSPVSLISLNRSMSPIRAQFPGLMISLSHVALSCSSVAPMTDSRVLYLRIPPRLGSGSGGACGTCGVYSDRLSSSVDREALADEVDADITVERASEYSERLFRRARFGFAVLLLALVEELLELVVSAASVSSASSWAAVGRSFLFLPLKIFFSARAGFASAFNARLAADFFTAGAAAAGSDGAAGAVAGGAAGDRRDDEADEAASSPDTSADPLSEASDERSEDSSDAASADSSEKAASSSAATTAATSSTRSETGASSDKLSDASSEEVSEEVDSDEA